MQRTDLLQAAMEAGIHINASCGGSATCGKCKVKILKGTVDSPQSIPSCPSGNMMKGIVWPA